MMMNSSQRAKLSAVPQNGMDPIEFFGQGSTTYVENNLSPPPSNFKHSNLFSDIPLSQEVDYSKDKNKDFFNFGSLETTPHHNNEEQFDSLSMFNSANSKGSAHADEMIDAIARSAHGASKYLHEVCDKLSIKGIKSKIEPKTVDKQMIFTAIVSLNDFTATKSARSKQDAKNAASLEVLRQLIANDHIAESSLKMILYKGSELPLT